VRDGTALGGPHYRPGMYRAQWGAAEDLGLLRLVVKHGWRKWPAIIADADHVDIKAGPSGGCRPMCGGPRVPTA